MKNKRTLLLIFTFMFLVVLVAAPGISFAKAKGASASGHGTYKLIDPIDLVTPYFDTFSFQARESGGQVTGSFVLKGGADRGKATSLWIKGEIDCLRVKEDGKTAVISGYITKVIYPAAPDVLEVGDEIWTQVQDNGEGNNADPDLKSEIFANHKYRRENPFEFLNDCTYDYPLSDDTGQPIYHPYGELILAGTGNFQVKP